MERIRRFYGKNVTAASVNLFSVQSEADIPLTPQGYGNTLQTLVLWNTAVLCIRRAFKIKKRDILYVLGINLFLTNNDLKIL